MDITFSLEIVPRVPDPPALTPVFTQGDLLSVYRSPEPRPEPTAIMHFPRFGQLRVDLEKRRSEGMLVEAALTTYGVLEDVIAMGLTAHLRRRGLFLIHAFAAVHHECALLLVGDIGSGKTTTGISLLRAGWKLLSNDSPLLTNEHLAPSSNPAGQAGSGQARRTTGGKVTALAYPGLLSADAGTLRRFPELARLTLGPELSFDAGAGNSRKKPTFAAESVYPGVWTESAPVTALVFPHVTHAPAHRVTALSEPEALRRLLPNAIDRWDTLMIPAHLQLLKTLVAQAPAYAVELGENVESLPQTLQQLVDSRR